MRISLLTLAILALAIPSLARALDVVRKRAAQAVSVTNPNPETPA